MSSGGGGGVPIAKKNWTVALRPTYNVVGIR